MQHCEEAVSTAVLDALADATNTPAENLPTPLHDVIDPDALDQLFRGRDTDGYVQFSYEGLTVTARSDGTVAIDD